jgi:hypothetical protein
MPGLAAEYETAFLKLILQGVPIPFIADNAATTPLADLYIGLHTADPTDTPAAGQAENETTYTGYSRVQIGRSPSGWAVTGNSASPVADIDFGRCTAGTANITHFHVGRDATGTGKIIISGAITPAIAVVAGVKPQLTPATTITMS